MRSYIAGNEFKHLRSAIEDMLMGKLQRMYDFVVISNSRNFS